MVTFHAPIEKFQCKFCTKIFESTKKLKDNEKRHNKSIECKLCAKKFEIQYKLKKHVEEVHVNRTAFKCENCDKKFNNKQSMMKHMALHDKNRPKLYKC